MVTKSSFFLVLVFSYSNGRINEPFAHQDRGSLDFEAKDDFVSVTETDMAHLGVAVDKHIPFEVDDKLYKGERFICAVDKRIYDNGPYNRKKYHDFTAVQKDCHKQHEAKMKQADYGDYSYCIVDNYNRLATSRDHMSLTPDNKTIISHALWGIVKLTKVIMKIEHPGICVSFCRAKFNEYMQSTTVFTPKESTKGYVTGPAINVLRQFRKCLGLSRLGDKYKWPAPK